MKILEQWSVAVCNKKLLGDAGVVQGDMIVVKASCTDGCTYESAAAVPLTPTDGKKGIMVYDPATADTCA